MPANGLAFAAPHLRYRSVSSNEAARSHPFISGIIASVSRSFRPRSAAGECPAWPVRWAHKPEVQTATALMPVGFSVLKRVPSLIKSLV
jgi:hypothetical protein